MLKNEKKKFSSKDKKKKTKIREKSLSAIVSKQ